MSSIEFSCYMFPLPVILALCDTIVCISFLNSCNLSSRVKTSVYQTFHFNTTLEIPNVDHITAISNFKGNLMTYSWDANVTSLKRCELLIISLIILEVMGRFELLKRYRISNILRYDYDFDCSKQKYEIFTELTFSIFLK